MSRGIRVFFIQKARGAGRLKIKNMPSSSAISSTNIRPRARLSLVSAMMTSNLCPLTSTKGWSSGQPVRPRIKRAARHQRVSFEVEAVMSSSVANLNLQVMLLTPQYSLLLPRQWLALGPFDVASQYTLQAAPLKSEMALER